MYKGRKIDILKEPMVLFKNHQSLFEDYTGKIIGHIAVLQEVIPYYSSGNKVAYRYLCRCDCGREIIIERPTLTKNMNNPDFNCGHLYDSWYKFIQPGDRFGKIEVLYNIDNYMLPSGKIMDLWRCKCECGTEFSIESLVLEHGAKSCGLCEDHKNAAPNAIDLTGKQIGRLTVIGRGPDFLRNNGGFRTTYWCKCSCGNPDMVLIKAECLTRKNPTSSCGCLHDEQCQGIGLNNFIHGLSDYRIYDTHKNMIDRCYNPNSIEYNSYGGKGIQVCDEWLNHGDGDYSGLMNFYNWAMANGYTDELTIDRIDRYGNYEPSNCRWVALEIQASNKIDSVFIDFEGNHYTMSQWARATGIDPNTIRRRIKSGQTAREILTTPVKSPKPKLINAIYYVDQWDNPIGYHGVEKDDE